MPVANLKLKRQLQAALSYREKVRRLREDCEARFAADQIDRALYENEQTTLLAHARMAEHHINSIRAEGLPRLDRMGRKLRKALARRQRLADSHASATSRKKLAAIEAEVERIRAGIAAYNVILSAEEAARLGGFLDMPLDSYSQTAQPRTGEFSLTRSNMILVAVAGVLMLLAVAGTYFFLQPRRGLNITAQRVAAESDIILIRCANVGDRPVTLYVPWDERKRAAGAYGIEVSVRLKDSAEYRLWPDVEGAWYYEGRTLRDEEAIVVPPLLHVELRFSLSHVRRLQPDAESVKIVVRDYLGIPRYSGVF